MKFRWVHHARAASAGSVLTLFAIGLTLWLGVGPVSVRADTPCPAFVDFVNGVPLPPRVGMSGAITPYSPNDSALLVAPVPFGGQWTRVNITITASSLDLTNVPTVTFRLAKVTGADSSLAGLLKCDSSTYLSETVTGTTGSWSTTIDRSVLIGDQPWNPPNFYIAGTHRVFADWTATATPCYVPGNVLNC